MSSAANNPDNGLDLFPGLTIRQMEDVLTLSKKEKMEEEEKLQDMYDDKCAAALRCAGVLVVKLAEANLAQESEEGIAFKANFWNGVQPGFQLMHEAISAQEEHVDGLSNDIRRMEEMRLEKSFMDHLDEHNFWDVLG